MGLRVAEHVVRQGLLRRRLLYRVDLHGVSVFGPGDEHALIRWEWLDEIAADGDAVVVRSETTEIRMPSGAFGLRSGVLAERLEAARSINDRPEVIAALAAGT